MAAEAGVHGARLTLRAGLSEDRVTPRRRASKPHCRSSSSSASLSSRGAPPVTRGPSTSAPSRSAPTCQDSPYLSFSVQLELHRHHRARGSSVYLLSCVTVAGDRGDPRVLEHGDVEPRGLFGLVVEPETRCNAGCRHGVLPPPDDHWRVGQRVSNGPANDRAAQDGEHARATAATKTRRSMPGSPRSKVMAAGRLRPPPVPYLTSTSTFSIFPVNLFSCSLYAELTLVPSSTPTSAASSAEKMLALVFSTRPDPTFLSLT
jgi:hypothetical protein